MSGPPVISVRGASEHNLKGVDIDIERGAITVITGVSGSGKSSLAFDTILAEAQRRFFYTLSQYSRQFLDLGARPAVRSVTGLSPAVSLAQNETLPSRRATVGTLTDLSELLGVMFARFGTQHCPEHGHPTGSMSVEAIAAQILETAAGKTIAVTAPLAEAKKGVFRTLLEKLALKGFLKVWIDGEIHSLAQIPVLAREEKHTIRLVVDYIKVKPDSQARLLRSLRSALDEGQGIGEWFVAGSGGSIDPEGGQRFSDKGGCPQCGYAWPALDSRYFSANSLGRCSACDGFGTPEAEDATEEADQESDDESSPEQVCAACHGTGLAARMDGIRLGSLTPGSVHSMSLEQLRTELQTFLATRPVTNAALDRVAAEVLAGLERVIEGGLGYLHLGRRVRTLSGGESQRLKLAGILAESLRGVLYVLDEPSQGLHPSEIEALSRSLIRLRDRGNTLILVDHDEHLMRAADWIIDLGPGGGARGGRVLARFRPADAARFRSQSVTAGFLADGGSLRQRGSVSGSEAGSESKGSAAAPAYISIIEPRLHNLRLSQARFRRGAVNVVAGVSGAGKSSLVLGSFVPALQNILAGKSRSTRPGGKSGSSQRKSRGTSRTTPATSLPDLTGSDDLIKAAVVDRRPLARSSSSIPATYLGIYNHIRDLYAAQQESQVMGLTARDFSLNVEGGRCPECKGRGELDLSMRFLADARVRCPVCRGQRFRPNILGVRYLGVSVNDVLNMTLDQVVEHFANHRKITAPLQPAVEIGLGYLKLGQPLSSLSGGEAQRLRLVPHLAARSAAGLMLVLDEPTTGLHFEDVDRLMRMLRRLCADGATAVMIEHHPDVIRMADWVVELGPGAAAAGGQLVFEGTPAAMVKCKTSPTAPWLGTP